jgi:hypothetical protein
LSRGYIFASALVVLAFAATAMASYAGWGLDSDASAEDRARRSVRGGSLHSRSYYGGGPGFGK